MILAIGTKYIYITENVINGIKKEVSFFKIHEYPDHQKHISPPMPIKLAV